MASGNRLHHRLLRPAFFLCKPAPVTEAAARRQSHGIGHQALDGIQSPLVHMDFGDGIHQPDGVGMPHILENFMDRSVFHHLAGIDDCRHLAGLGHNTQIMGNQDGCRIKFLFQVLHHFQHLGLNGHIQGRRRLVGNENLRVAGQGNGNDYPLLHSA